MRIWCIIWGYLNICIQSSSRADLILGSHSIWYMQLLLVTSSGVIKGMWILRTNKTKLKTYQLFLFQFIFAVWFLLQKLVVEIIIFLIARTTFIVRMKNDARLTSPIVAFVRVVVWKNAFSLEWKESIF